MLFSRLAFLSRVRIGIGDFENRRIEIGDSTVLDSSAHPYGEVLRIVLWSNHWSGEAVNAKQAASTTTTTTTTTATNTTSNHYYYNYHNRNYQFYEPLSFIFEMSMVVIEVFMNRDMV